MPRRQSNEQLAQADRLIASAEKRVARQKEVIASLVEHKSDCEVARSLLHALEKGLEAFKGHRDQIIKIVKTSDSKASVPCPLPARGWDW